MVEHQNGLGAGASYLVTTQVQVPPDLSGPYYLFVITDPPTDSPIGKLFEGGEANEDNNSLYLAPPLVIDPPPPSQLAVTGITLPDPATVKSGDPFSVSWTVTDESTTNPAPGSWSDAVYIGTGTSWSIADVYLGTVTHTGTLQPGKATPASLEAVMPSLSPGQYHIFVRTDIYDQLSLPAGRARLHQDVGLRRAVDGCCRQPDLGRALCHHAFDRSRTAAASDRAARRHAAGNDQLECVGRGERDLLEAGAAPTQSTTTPPTRAVFHPIKRPSFRRRHRAFTTCCSRAIRSRPTTRPVSVLAQLLPLSITNVQVDQGGDSEYVTTKITGAQFQPNAIVKLVMPGFAEYQPLLTNFVNSTEILAEFDLTGAPFGLYDVQVINPDGQEAIAPYRFEIEQTVQPNVAIGVGGPRFILAGDTGTYSVSLQNLGNINAPYVEFNVGIPQLSNALPTDLSNPNIADPVNVNLDDLPYVELNTNLGGEPPDSTLDSEVPYATLQSQADTVATNGHIEIPGYLFNEAAGGFAEFTFDVTTYPGMEALNDKNFAALEAEIYAAFPAYAREGILNNGPRASIRSRPSCTRRSRNSDPSPRSFRSHTFHSSLTSTPRRRRSPSRNSWLR